jgi:hypothetical protein
LRASDPESAVKLAQELAAKLQGEKLLENPEAANLAVNLLRVARTPSRRPPTPGGASASSNTPLLFDEAYKDLFSKTLADGLSYSAPTTNVYSPERNAAQNILGSLKSMTPEMEGYARGSVDAVEKKTLELNTNPDPQSALWQKYQNTIGNGPLDAALEAVGKAPREMRDQLYQQVASKAAGAGDFDRARQILTDHISNPFQRQQALSNMEQQAIQNAVSKGKIDEALRRIGNLHTAKERAVMLSQVVNQIGPGQKKATALNLLEQARAMLSPSLQAENQEQMNALFEIVRAFSRYDSKRAFEVVEPLLDQFNEMSTAAVLLNGFGQEYFQDGELMMNGNTVANVANQLTTALGTLATANFDRAKAAADRVQRPEVRIGAYLAIAQQTVGPEDRLPENGMRQRFRE